MILSQIECSNVKETSVHAPITSSKRGLTLYSNFFPRILIIEISSSGASLTLRKLNSLLSTILSNSLICDKRLSTFPTCVIITRTSGGMFFKTVKNCENSSSFRNPLFKKKGLCIITTTSIANKDCPCIL